MKLRTQNTLLAIGVIVIIDLGLVGSSFYVGHSGGYTQGFLDGTDSTISITKKSTANLHSLYKRSTARIDSVLAIYEARQTESFPKHSEIKP